MTVRHRLGPYDAWHFRLHVAARGIILSIAVTWPASSRLQIAVASIRKLEQYMPILFKTACICAFCLLVKDFFRQQ